MILRLLILLALSATAACAQMGVSIAINKNPEQFERDVEAGLKARINGTTRFSVADFMKAELSLQVICMTIPNVVGGICAYAVAYFPDGFFGLNVEVTDVRVVSNSSAAAIAENIFDGFMEGTSQDNLKKCKTVLAEQIVLAADALKKPIH